MKKRINALNFIVLGLIAYFISLLFGVISRNVFGFSNIDINSSSATLLAGIIAVYLYTDFKREHIINRIVKLHDDLKNLNQARTNQYNLIISKAMSFKADNNREKLKQYENEINHELGRFLMMHQNFIGVVIEYEVFLEKNNSKLVDNHLKKIIKIRDRSKDVAEEIKIIQNVENIFELQKIIYGMIVNNKKIYQVICLDSLVVSSANPDFYAEYLEQI